MQWFRVVLRTHFIIKSFYKLIVLLRKREKVRKALSKFCERVRASLNSDSNNIRWTINCVTAVTSMHMDLARNEAAKKVYGFFVLNNGKINAVKKIHSFYKTIYMIQSVYRKQHQYIHDKLCYLKQRLEEEVFRYYHS